MKNLLLLGFLFLSQVAFGEVRNEVVISSQPEIRKFLSNPHSYIYDLAATPYLERSSSASDIMKERLKDYLTGSYHLSRVNTGSSVRKLKVNLSDFNKKDSDDRILCILNTRTMVLRSNTITINM
ncbi:MAG: hypothetical protein IPJ71_13075 [Bdellovibrionales bacterium]|nr:hypothetical protein [Bdellovibrionales bacterium]